MFGIEGKVSVNVFAVRLTHPSRHERYHTLSDADGDTTYCAISLYTQRALRERGVNVLGIGRLAVHGMVRIAGETSATGTPSPEAPRSDAAVTTDSSYLR